MQLQLDCVDAFHKRLEISKEAPWEPNNQDIGEKLIDVSQRLQESVNENTHDLRAHLLIEELGEYLASETEEDALDGLTDLLYVLLGTALTYNWPLEEAFAEVHRSNMTKIKQSDDRFKARVREKGEEYEPPNIKTVLKIAREQGFDIHRRNTSAAAVKKIHDAFFKEREEQ